MAMAPRYQMPRVYEDHRSQQKAVTIDGHQIAYTDHGKGPTLLLLHGVPTSSWLYRKMIPNLQDHFRVVSVDLLGYGSSSKPKKPSREKLGLKNIPL